MCGHGTIGTVTMAIENGLVRPKTPGVLRLDTPAGLVIAEYRQDGEYVEEVRITNVPSFLHAEGLTVECPELGEIRVDVAYGGNFYAIVEPQENYRDMADYSAGDLIAWSPVVRQRLNEKYSFVHPENPDDQPAVAHAVDRRAEASGSGCAQRRVLRRQGDRPLALRHRHLGAHGAAACQGQAQGRRRLRARNRSSARCSRGASRGRSSVAGKPAIIPSIGGWARMTGLNTIFIDDRDPFAHGFVVHRMRRCGAELRPANVSVRRKNSSECMGRDRTILRLSRR